MHRYLYRRTICTYQRSVSGQSKLSARCLNSLSSESKLFHVDGTASPILAYGFLFVSPCLLGQKLTRTMMINFCLHLNWQKIARATQKTKWVKINVPNMFYPFAIGLWVQCQKVATVTYIKNGVKEKCVVQKCQKCYIAHMKDARWDCTVSVK
jgi:hypothetical protein